ncbi:MAG: septum formation inhibitor Maf [Nitrospirae bacterium]|nr:septum formation inhibitor Maf [Nitrospirota bacterium]
MTAPILLASASPRRRELLAHLGRPFTCTRVDADETPLPGETPQGMVIRLAEMKARAAHHNPHGVTIGADTVVTLDGIILGKPVDADDAARMLARLQGRDHTVWTGVAVLGPGDRSDVLAEATRVWFRPMTHAEIDAYVATGEPLDKAGAYGIQEKGARFVEKVEGDYFTVVGLPLCRLGTMLDQALGPASV